MTRLKKRQQRSGEAEHSAAFRPAEFGLVSYRPGEGWVFEGIVARQAEQELTAPEHCSRLLQQLATALGVKKVCVMPNGQQPVILVAVTPRGPMAITTCMRSIRSSVAMLALEAAQKGWGVTFYENVSHVDCAVITMA